MPLRTRLTCSIGLVTLLVSIAMDTVTEARLAIVMTQQGGTNIVHENLKPEEQTREVAKARRFRSGVLCDLATIGPGMKVHDVVTLSTQRDTLGFPVLEGKRMVSIITNRDLRFEGKPDAPVRARMTPSEKLVTVKEGVSLEKAKYLMNKHHLKRVLVVGEAFELRGLITVKDIQKTTKYPLTSKDERGSLCVGAAVGMGPDNNLRIDLLVEAGVDVIIVDTAHGHSQNVLNHIHWIKDSYPQVQMVDGSIATGDAIRALVDRGADGVKVGTDPGSIYTTRVVAGVGVPQISTVSNMAEVLKNADVPPTVDGGVRYPGGVVKALVTGAYIVMMSGMFADTDESPGEVLPFQGCSYKSYRGTDSVGAMKDGAADRYFQGGDTANIDKLVPENIENRVPYKGSALPTVRQPISGTRSSMGCCGYASIAEWHEKVQLVGITAADMNESHAHDV